MSQSHYVISVDLGGTNLRVGAVRSDGSIEEKEKYNSDARKGNGVVFQRVAEAVQSVAKKITAKKGKVVGLSLGIPGIVNPQTGIVYQSPHFPDWKNIDVLSLFKNQFSWPIVIDNDANFAALGEGWKGAAVGLKNFVMLTFGTGVGGGIVIEEKLLHGDRGFAGEVGHICIDVDGPACACGSRGCWEVFVSSHGIMRLIEVSEDIYGREKLLQKLGMVVERITVNTLHEAARDGDMFANMIFKKMGYFLGIGIASLVNTLGIENFVLGGGISQAWDFFIEPARRELGQRTYAETAQSVQLKQALLGDDAGLIGGASSFFKK